MNDKTSLHDIAKPASEKLDAVTLIAAEAIQRLWVYNREGGDELHRRLLDVLSERQPPVGREETDNTPPNYGVNARYSKTTGYYNTASGKKHPT